MRCFIAIDIDEGIRRTLSNLQQQLAGSVDIKKSDAKWVNPENIHLTLKFLGEIKDQDSFEVCNVVKDVADRHNNFELDVGTIGYFGGKSARVLWVSTGEGNDKLLRLQEDIEKQLASAGWPQDKKGFAGHLTLCRVRNSKAGFKLAKITEDYKNFKLGTMPADSVSVYQSKLTPAGPVYTVLGNYKLQ